VGNKLCLHGQGLASLTDPDIKAGCIQRKTKIMQSTDTADVLDLTLKMLQSWQKTEISGTGSYRYGTGVEEPV